MRMPAIFFRMGAEAAVALLLAYGLAALAGALYSHPQPFAVYGFEPLIAHAVDNSFPSHHTLAFSVLAMVVYLRYRRAGLLLWGLAGLVGVLRVAAGLHWPVDIVAAAALGAIAAALVHLAFNAIRRLVYTTQK